MSGSRPRSPRPPERARQAAAAQAAAAQAAARRRRWAWLASSALVVAGVGALIGLHVATSRSSATPGTQSAAAPTALAAGHPAPNATFTTLAGKVETVASLAGKPTLLWLMTTWCSSCQASTQTLAANLAKLQAAGVQVVEVENYADLGQSGPSLTAFAKTLAGAEFTNPDWTFGEASAGLTRTYNPQSDLDIYYLINASGQITYVNSSPVSTMPQLLAAARSLT